MAITTKYNYDGTVDLLKKVADTTQIITRAELMQILCGHIVTDRAEVTRFLSAVHTLRTGRLKKAGIGIEAITVGKKQAKGEVADYKVYYLQATTKPVKVDNNIHALEKDNQRLFLELEELKKNYDILEREYRETVRREASYKALVQTYHALAMGV